ncbi:MAG: thioredoxin [Bacteroidales bacterium]|jgi:thioredoxin 1|nr:thioredoxin [Bacteroidales bacterium]
MAVEINERNFEELVLKSDKPVMIDFWAEWCGPCRAIAPYVEQIATEYEGKAVVGKVDVEQCPDITNKYGIRNIPAILFFKGGELVDKQVGMTSKAALAEKLDTLL